MPSPSYKLRGDADVFTPKSSPTTLYHEIRPGQFVESQNCAFQSSDSVSQIDEALAKVETLSKHLRRFGGGGDGRAGVG